MALVDLLDRGALLAPERNFALHRGRAVSYAQAVEHVERIARRLRADGIVPGDRVAVYGPNDADALLVVYGIVRAGATWVALNARSSSELNLGVVRFTEASLVFYHSTFAEVVADWTELAPELRERVCLDEPDGNVPSLAVWLDEDQWTGRLPTPRPDATVALLPTGGTTGRPKAVQLTNLNIDAMAANWLHAMPCAPAHAVHMLAAPMTHGAGLAAFALTGVGATHVIHDYVDVSEILDGIEQHRVTHLFLPPTVIYLMLEHPEVTKRDYRSLEYFVYGAAPMSVDRLRGAISVFGPVMAQVFGQIEAPMTCTCLTPDEHRVPAGKEHRLLSAGRPTLLTAVAVMDQDGELLARDRRGEIVVRGPLVTPGYFRDPQATADATYNGWHRTGDIGYLDGDGYLYIVDRKRDLIISGGFNVFPSEVERVIWMHPAVQDCAVIGTPDPKWGEVVTAVVELRPGATLAAEELISFCRERLDGMRTPKRVEIVRDLPRSPVGKVLKREVRDRFWHQESRAV